MAFQVPVVEIHHYGKRTPLLQKYFYLLECKLRSDWIFPGFPFSFPLSLLYGEHFRIQVSKPGPASQIQLVDFCMAHKQQMAFTFQNAWEIIFENIVIHDN